MQTSIAAVTALFVSLIASLLIGLISSKLGHSVDLQVVVLCRAAMGLITALALAAIYKVSLPFTAPPGLWTRSLLGAMAIQLTFYALMTLPLSTSIATFHTGPVWTAIFTWFFLGQRIQPLLWCAIACSLLGVALIYQPTFHANMGGILAALLSATLQSLAIICVYQMPTIHPLKIVIHSSALASAGALLLLVTLRGWSPLVEIQAASAKTVVLLTLLGLFGCISQLLITFSAKRLSPLIVSTARILEVPAAIALTAFSRPEPFSISELLGAAMVTIGAATLTIYALPSLPSLAAIPVAQRRQSEELTLLDAR